MAWVLFIDESGHDRKASPYEVLAGIAVRDRDLWPMIGALHQQERTWFGGRYSSGPAELKGRNLLSSKVFRHAQLNCEITQGQIPPLARAALDDGAKATVRHFRALALAKLGYVRDVFDICEHYGCRAFASIVETDAPGTATNGLRKDYAYLFQRFYYFLQDQEPQEMGLIVFDELEKSRSHVLIDQAHRYFRDTAVGQSRAGLIVPEPLFVHSDLTTGVQLADLIAYCISWGFRTSLMTKPARPEMDPFARQVARLRYRAERPRQGRDFIIWSFARITDLRTRSERELDE